MPYIVEVSGLASEGELTAVPSHHPTGFDAAPCAPLYVNQTARCVVTSENDRIYVRVQSHSPDGFELTVRAVASGSHGRLTSPVRIEVPYRGVASSAAASYYAVSGFTIDTRYVLRVSGSE